MPTQTYSFVPDEASDTDDADDTVALLDERPQPKKTGAALPQNEQSSTTQEHQDIFLLRTESIN